MLQPELDAAPVSVTRKQPLPKRLQRTSVQQKHLTTLSNILGKMEKPKDEKLITQSGASDWTKTSLLKLFTTRARSVL
jgi:hypothetical protein